MMMSTGMQFIFAAVYLWIGFVCAISFFESWLKFRAPGVTLPVGLGIGRLIFTALNKIEWTIAALILALIFISGAGIFSLHTVPFFLPLGILLLQTIWLLPALDARTEFRLQGHEPPPSKLHLSFVIMEAVKIISLILFSTQLSI